MMLGQKVKEFDIKRKRWRIRRKQIMRKQTQDRYVATTSEVIAGMVCRGKPPKTTSKNADLNTQRPAING